MSLLIGLIKKHFIKKEFLLFIIIGTVNTFNGTILAFAFSILLQANIAFMLGYITGLVIAYFLNSFFVFHAKLQILKFIKFAASYIPNFIIQNIFVLIFYNGLLWNKLFVFALAAIFGIPLTFIILKVFTFKK